MDTFVNIILPIPIDGVFTYRCNDFCDSVAIGKRVLVNFGKSKFYAAIICEIHHQKPEHCLVKDIISVLDETPIVTPQQIKFWQWISEYYMSPIGDVMQAAVPTVFRLCSETKIAIHPEFDGEVMSLSEQEIQILNLLNQQKTITLKELNKTIGDAYAGSQIKNMVDKSLIVVCEEIEERYKPKMETFISLSQKYIDQPNLLQKVLEDLEEKKNTQAQADILLQFIAQTKKEHCSCIKKSLFLQNEIVTESRLAAMIKKNIFVNTRQSVSRLESFQSIKNANNILLSEQQEIAFQSVKQNFTENKPVLLHGVTGSGKTAIYIKLIQEYIDQGKNVLYLLPEITLTEQMINRIRSYFGDIVGVYHSRYNSMQRAEIWQDMLNQDSNKYKIILGTRSSILLPFKNLKLIIIDEEHDASFKQFDPSPRYQARDCAIMLAKMFSADVLLGSATPSLESYWNCRNGKYTYVPLLERYGGIQLPHIEIINTKKARINKLMHKHYSQALLDKMQEVLDNKQQIILFQNRRGYAPHLECETCQFVPTCEHCDVTLTYHKKTSELRCHHCDYTIPAYFTCPTCHQPLKIVGFGTEKIEDDLQEWFPKAKIARLDYDATKAKNSYQQIISDFEQQKTDILIGTQMVTKGLDFDNVALVGILNADNMLNYPDFRAFERAFQLLMQVSGRAGRKKQQGLVMIQTQNPDNEIFKHVIDADYKTLYEQLLAERKQFFYPPWSRMMKISLQHKDDKVLDAATKEFMQILKSHVALKVSGPEYALIPRVKNVFRKEIIIKMPLNKDLPLHKQQIATAISEFKSMSGHSNISFIIDIDMY